MFGLRCWLLAACIWLLVPGVGWADIITNADVTPISDGAIGSGNGTLDLLLLTESAGGSENKKSGFDADDACTDMPTGGSSNAVCESYITSIGDLRAFFDLNFSRRVDDMVLCVDVNETGGSNGVEITTLTVVVDYSANFGDQRDDPAGGDIPSSMQNTTGAGFSGGTVVASLDGPKVLPLTWQGAGFADVGICLGIDPYDSAFSDSTRILFHWQSGWHDDGGETVFISGMYRPEEIPEPGAAALLLLWGVPAIARRSKRRRSR